MGLKDLVSKAEQLTEAATGAAEKLVDEFNEALPTMSALGFTVKDLKVGMGLMPEIDAKLVASAGAVDPKKIKELMDKNPDNKTLAAALKALLAAYHLKQMVGSIPFKGVELDMKLGIPPHVGIGFVSVAPAEPAEAASAGPVQV
jgi:hypothetical protein